METNYKQTNKVSIASILYFCYLGSLLRWTMSDSEDSRAPVERAAATIEKKAAPVAEKPASKDVKEDDSSDDDVPLGQRKVEKQSK